MTSSTTAHRTRAANGSDGATGAQGVVAEIRSLTGLRIVAALWVVFFHLSWAPGDAYTRYWEPVLPLVRHGHLGVDLFFILSGFVITLTYLTKLGSRPSVRGATAFWWARICRMWPVHAVMTTIFGVWLVWKAAQGRPGPVAYQSVQPVVDWVHWVEQMLMVQVWHRPSYAGSSWVGPAWSISAEWAAYVVFPFLALILWRLRNAPALVTGSLAVVCMMPIVYVSNVPGGVPYSWAVRIGCGFLAGALVCLAVRRISWTERVDRIAARVAVLATVEILIALWANSSKTGSANVGVLAVLAFPVLVGALALSRRGMSRWLSTDVMVLGGKISFALYLVHIPVLEVAYTLMAWYPRLAPGTGLATLLLPNLFLGSVFLAYLIHRFLEEPARLSLRGARLPGRSRAARGAAASVVEVPATPVPHAATSPTDLVPTARTAPVGAGVGS